MTIPVTQNLVLRVPLDLLAQIEVFTEQRGGSRHANILTLLKLGLQAHAHNVANENSLRRKLRAKIEKLQADPLLEEISA